MQVLELIIFAGLAGVVLYQLYAVLGRRVGRQPEDTQAADSVAASARQAPAMDQIDDPSRSGDLLAFVQGGGYIIASLSPLAAGLLRDHMADLTGAWVLMGAGVVVLGVMTLQFRPGLPKLR